MGVRHHVQRGISISGDALDSGVARGLIAKSGNTYSFGETKLGTGRENAKQFLRENPKVMAEIKKQVWQKVRSVEPLPKSA